MTSRSDALHLDGNDPLRTFREQFIIPDNDVIYLDGNSLGRTPKATMTRLQQVVEEQWAGDLIGSWEHWLDMPRQVGDLMTSIIGSKPGEVAVHDNTTLNIFQGVHIAMGLRPDRKVLVIANDEFPTDRYVVQGIATDNGLEVRSLEEKTDLSDVAVVVRSVIDYRTAEMCDVAGFTAQARTAGAMVLWDLSHAAGAIEIDLHALTVELAVGCSYKYLNGGPGAPAWTYVAQELHSRISQPIKGWFAQKNQFAMDHSFEPHDDIRRVLLGTPHILSLVAAHEGISLCARAGMPAIATKGRALTDFALRVVDHFHLQSSTPRDPLKRGCHIAIHHPQAQQLVSDLAKKHQVIADVRPPDIVRFGLSPLTTRFTDVWDGIEHLAKLIGA